MSAIRIRKKIVSDTLHLPELAPFIGHTVDICIEERPDNIPPPAGVVPGKGDWDAVLNATRRLVDFDYDAQRDQDARDIRDAQDHLR